LALELLEINAKRQSYTNKKPMYAWLSIIGDIRHLYKRPKLYFRFILSVKVNAKHLKTPNINAQKLTTVYLVLKMTNMTPVTPQTYKFQTENYC
jgi:hypothetical protein